MMEVPFWHSKGGLPMDDVKKMTLEEVKAQRPELRERLENLSLDDLEKSSGGSNSNQLLGLCLDCGNIQDYPCTCDHCGSRNVVGIYN